MKKKTTGNALRGTAGALAALMCVSVGTTGIAQSLKTYVNQALGTSSVRTIQDGDGSEDTTYFESEFSSVSELVAARDAINEQVVEEGAVLLKNENDALPLAASPKVTLLGMGSHQAMYDISSGAAAIANDEQIVTYETAFAERGMELNSTMIAFYESLKDTYKPEGPGGFGPTAGKGFIIGEVPMSEYGTQQIESLEQYNDAAIVFIERNIGEGYDIPDTPVNDIFLDGDGEHDGLQLQNTERELLEFAKEHFDTVIVLLNSSNPIECGELQADEGIDAIMWTGAVGTRGSYGIADLLLGNENPSGGLVDTYATDNHSAPAAMNMGSFEFANSDEINNPTYGSYYIVEAEGVYIGYKYYETRYLDAVLGQGNATSSAGVYASEGQWNYADEVVYPFGYGLSYTTFEERITDSKLTEDGLEVTVEVTNTGDVAGMDNVQLYLQAPYTDYDKQYLVEKPFTFIGAGKTSELDPGASSTLVIQVDRELLASYDYMNAEDYLLEAGTYYIAVGDGAHDAVNNVLALMGATGMTDQEGNAVEGNTDAAATFEVAETIYLYSDDENVDIENRFQDFCDLNSFQPGTVTYLSRQDWEGTYPKSYTGIVAEGVSPNGVDMLAELSGDTYVADTTQTVDFEYGNPNNTNYSVAMMIGNEDYNHEGWDLLLTQMSVEDYVALLLPMIDPTQVGSDAGFGISFPGATGSEGPSGNAVGFATQEDHEQTNTPYYMTEEEEADPYLSTYNCSSMHQQSMLAATFNPQLAYRMGEIFGEDTLWAHCTAMEIGVNNHRTAYSGRNCEYYSECGNLSYIMAYQETAGIQSKGGYSMPKHYFGNDQETHRQGLATFANEAAMREIQMRASEGAFKAGATKYMTSFSRYGVIQSAYCKESYDVLYEEWGVTAAVNLTDMAFNNLMYGARSVVAGTNTFCSFSYDPDSSMSYYGILDAEHVESDPALLAAARESAKMQLYIWANSNDANGYSSSVRFESVTTWWEMALVAVDVVLGVGALACGVLYLVKRGKREEVK